VRCRWLVSSAVLELEVRLQVERDQQIPLKKKAAKLGLQLLPALI
jgi:hypothetical protein